MKSKLLTLILITGLISACGSQPTESPASTPTEEIVSVTDAPSPTDVAIPPTEVPTEEPTLELAVSTEVSFANDILPLLQSRCRTCHGGDRGIEEGLDLNSYADLMAGSNNGPVVLAKAANSSLLAEMLIENKMPKRGPKLAPTQVQLIIDWINQGALNN